MRPNSLCKNIYDNLDVFLLTMLIGENHLEHDWFYGLYDNILEYNVMIYLMNLLLVLIESNLNTINYKTTIWTTWRIAYEKFRKVGVEKLPPIDKESQINIYNFIEARKYRFDIFCYLSDINTMCYMTKCDDSTGSLKIVSIEKLATTKKLEEKLTTSPTTEHCGGDESLNINRKKIFDFLTHIKKEYLKCIENIKNMKKIDQMELEKDKTVDVVCDQIMKRNIKYASISTRELNVVMKCDIISSYLKNELKTIHYFLVNLLNNKNLKIPDCLNACIYLTKKNIYN